MTTGSGPPTPPPVHHGSKDLPEDRLVLPDVEDDSDQSDISDPEDVLNNDPIDIYNMVTYPDITQTSMFPCGIPSFLDESLPFNPASLHITSDMCNANYLNTVELEIVDSNVNLNRLIQRRRIYTRQQKILKTNSDKILSDFRCTKKNHPKFAKYYTKKEQDLAELITSNRFDINRVRQQLRRQHLLRNSIRLGIQYRIEFPLTSFLVFLSEFGPLLQKYNTPLSKPFPTPRKRQKRQNEITNHIVSHEPLLNETFFSIDNDTFTLPIKHASTIDELVTLQNFESKLIIIPNNHFSAEFQTQKEFLLDMFIMFKSTILGYFKYQQEVTNCVDQFMMYYKVLDQNSLDTVKKLHSINEMRTTLRELMLNDLRWYYQAKKSLNLVQTKAYTEINKLL